MEPPPQRVTIPLPRCTWCQSVDCKRSYSRRVPVGVGIIRQRFRCLACGQKFTRFIIREQKSTPAGYDVIDASERSGELNRP